MRLGAGIPLKVAGRLGPRLPSFPNADPTIFLSILTTFMYSTLPRTDPLFHFASSLRFAG